MFAPGSPVEVLSSSQGRWFKDGVVVCAHVDGAISVRFNSGTELKDIPTGDQGTTIRERRTRDVKYDLSDHLMNGIMLGSARAFVDRLAFPETYVRDWKLDWVGETYGVRLAGYDFCDAIRSWLISKKREASSVVETLYDSHDSGVGSADIFLSHVQAESLESTFAGMEGALATNGYGCRKQEAHGLDTIFWLDYFVLKQNMDDFEPKKVAKVIGAIGCTRVIVDQDLTYFKRSFCVLELGASFMGYPPLEMSADVSIRSVSLEDGTKVLVPRYAGPKMKDPTRCTRLELFADSATIRLLGDVGVPRIDAKNAECRKQQEKALIDEFIERDISAHYYDNQMANAEYVKTADETWRMLNETAHSLMKAIVEKALTGNFAGSSRRNSLGTEKRDDA